MDENHTQEATQVEAHETSDLAHLNYVDALYGVMASPVVALRDIAASKPVAAGILIYAVIALLTAIADIPGANEQLRNLPSQFGRVPININSPGLIAFRVIATPIIAAIWIVLLGGVYHTLASLFKGNGDYRGLVSALGFANFPKIVLIPLALLALAAGTVGDVLYGLASIAVWFWVAVLAVIAIRENYGLSTGKAVWVFVIPVLALILLFGLLIALFVALIVGTIASGARSI